jgi:2-polyprenyl-3-methyl-5-hydroxy-6-metoxy-1,4-benzoquinol methylase
MMRSSMSEYDRESWEERWSQALRAHGDRVAQRPPNAHLTAEVGDLRPGRALDAGCGHGSDTLWLAARGWQVTAVDFAVTALAYARSTAEAMAPDVAERIDWVEADLATWTPQRDGYDLVVCLYVHVAGSVEEMVRRMATGVARGGTLFWLVIAPSTRPPEPRRPRPGRYRSLWRPRSPPSIRASGSRSSPMSARGRQPVPASMP